MSFFNGGGGGGGGDVAAAMWSMYNGTDREGHEQLLHRIAEEYVNQTHWFSTGTVVALVVSYCLVITLGLLGNLHVVLVMVRRKVR
jgi:hypothetical protein